jgi:hypothetical protein
MEVIILFRQFRIFQQMNDDEALANSILNKALSTREKKEQKSEDTQVQPQPFPHSFECEGSIHPAKVHHKGLPQQACFGAHQLPEAILKERTGQITYHELLVL